ncbi:MAG: hypothetical protein AAF328_09130 [Planctomycetota bacterium]
MPNVIDPQTNSSRAAGSSVPPDLNSPSTRAINKSFCTEKLRGDYPHVGLYDVSDRRIWLAKNKWGMPASRVSHAKLLKGGGQNHSVADKDRFVCYWFHTPDTGSGPLQGYPIEWNEGHLIVRLDPNWSYQTCSFIPPADVRRVEKNIEQQYDWARRVFEAYCGLGLKFPLSWHMLGPRTADSMFYVERHEP